MVFITGTDEHGEKIALAAAAKGRAPRDHCDAVAAEYQTLWEEVSSICVFNLCRGLQLCFHCLDGCFCTYE